ncbi:MAG TPA: hypothetical protein VMV69_25080 [Pirellulales bacterium]|nr:hypothetical protein [Pirellulales bacterium]
MYRSMTPGERLQLTLRMIDEAMPFLFAGPADVVSRRFELIRRQNDERNRLMLEGIARSKGMP